MRLFVALWPDVAVRDQLAIWQRALVGAPERPVAAELFHLTLVFIGERDAAWVRPIQQCLAAIPCEAFDIVLDRVGHFPEAQVLWAGSTVDSPDLLRLREDVHARLAGVGAVAGHATPFLPHVTLARGVRRVPDTPPCGALPDIRWRVARACLVESGRSAGRLHYRPLP